MSNASRVEALFFAAVAIGNAAERTAYLDSACGGDAELRRQVEKLLNAHPKVGDFLQNPVVESLAAEPSQLDATQELNLSTAGPGAVHTGRPGPDPLRTEGGQASDEDIALDFLEPSGRPGSLGRLGHYEVLQVLGKGGFGIVFRAFDDTLQRVVAVKVLAPEMAAASPARKRFLREARSSAKVRHEHIVQVYAVEEQPLPYLVMEFIPGETLQQRIDRTGPLETAEVVQIGRQVAEGLAAAHGMGLIHRDIKPANILIEAGPHQHIKITDFGLARAADDASATQSGLVSGTPMYMAPEQAAGDTLDHRADLFSLGSVLYTICSGRPPFRANNTLAVLKRVAEDTPRPIPEIIPEVPQWLCDIITRLHAKKPEDRIGTAQEVADLLGRGLADMQRPGQVAPAAPVKIPRPREITETAPAHRPSRFRTGRWAAAAAGILLLLGGLGITEATGVTNVRGTVIRLFTPEGTLVVEVDDPDVSVQIDGSDLVIKGAGLKEIRLKAGNHTVEARKDGKLVRQVLVTITKNDKQIVKVTQDPPPPGPKDAPGWTVLKPIEMKSEGGATLTLQRDNSILASGKLPPKDSYTILFRDLPTRIQALRLEVLTHDSLPNKGPGRDPGFSFVLTKVKAALDVSGNKGQPRVLKLARAWADSSSGDDSLPPFAIDEDDNTGWSAEIGKPHFAVFELAEPVTASEGMVLRVTLECKHDHPQLVLGCFRLSAAADAPSWESYVAALPAAEQVKAVVKSLQELNPGFDGKLTHAIKDGVVTELQFLTDEVTNIAPVRALKGLSSLSCRGTYPKKGKLSDLSPLKGMALNRLEFSDTQVTELTSLSGMPLTIVDCSGTQVSDLASLKGMALAHLACANTSISDLSPLKGMKLRTLGAMVISASDLTPLQGMPLTSLDLYATRGVTNLKPLQGMPLDYLNLSGLPVADLAVLKDMTSLRTLVLDGMPLTDLTALRSLKLKQLSIDYKPEREEFLRSLRELEAINGKPAVQFWKEVDALVKDPDRRAALYLLSIGGIVKVNGQGNEIRAAADLPREAFRLTNANLWEKKVTAAGLAAFKDCKNLKELELHRSNVTDEGLAHFKDCKDLTFLNLTGTPVTDAGLAAFKDCKNLTHLNLSDGQITDSGLAHFKDCNNLTELSLYFTRVTGEGLAAFKGCKNLTFLNLFGTQVTDAALVQLKDFKNLTRLSLAESQITDAGLAHLKDCTSLKTLELKGRAAGSTKVTAAGIDTLKKALPKCNIEWDGAAIDPKMSLDPDRRGAEYVLSVGGKVKINEQDQEIRAADLPREAFRITYVMLDKNPQVSDASLAHFKDCKNVTDLGLMNMPIGDAGVAHFKECKNLTNLGLSATQVGDAGVAHFKDCKKLLRLNVGGTRVTDAGLAIFKDCKNLTLLHLWITGVTDAGLANFKDCKDLTNLNLAHTKATEAGLTLFRDCKQLEWLVLNGVPVTDAGFAPFKNCTNLTRLELRQTKVTAALIDELRKELPKCRIEWDGGVIDPK